METLQVLNVVLQAIGALVVIAGGLVTLIIQLRKLAPRWHAHATNWGLAFGPAVFSLGGTAMLFIWNMPIVAAAMFVCAFVGQIAGFVRDPKPVSRGAIVSFGLACSAFVLAINMAIFVPLINGIVKLIGGNLDLIKVMSDTLGRLIH